MVAAIQSTSAAERETIVLRIFSDAALTNPGKERLLAFIDRLQSEFNPLEYHHSDLMAVELSPGNISRVLHIYLRKKDASMWRDIQMRLDPLPPYKLLNVAFIAEVAEPVSLPNGDKGWKEAKHGKRGSPAGGGYSTLRDMLLFSKGLKNNAFVSVESF